MSDDGGRKNGPKKRRTQREFLDRLTVGIGAARDVPKSENQRPPSHPAPTALLLVTYLVEVARGQNRALAEFLEYCRAAGPDDVSLLAIGDLPKLATETTSIHGAMMEGFAEAMNENRRLRLILGDRIIRKPGPGT
jgi:hypothetical protein